jgi:hypothetical protein
MKKLAIIGTVFASFVLTAATAQAVKPVDMSQGEYRALPVRSEGLNQKYGVVSQQAALRGRLEEIGAWAVPSTSKQMPLAHQPQQTTVREQLGEIGAWAVPSTSAQVVAKPLLSEKLAGLGLPTSTTTVVASSSGGFDWNDAGIGAAFLLGVVLLGAASLATFRRHSFKPVAH